MNLGFKLAKGDWIVSLSADDWYVNDFEPFKKYLNNENDLVFFNLEVNSGQIWHVSQDTMNIFVGAVKFIRREFLGNTRIPTDRKWHEDIPFTQALYDKSPRCVFTDIVLKHYNWPREGSLIWQAEHENGKTKDD